MARDSIVNYAVDDLFSSTGIGSLDKAISLNHYGFNFQQTPTLVPRNKEQPGYVFFTRPQLNMQGDNIRNMRQFYNLLSADHLSKERFIRCTLDPRLSVGYTPAVPAGGDVGQTTWPEVTSPLVDPENPFIPILSNNLLTLTGWPEEVMTFQRSKEDVYRGTHSQAQGYSFVNSSYTLSATFRNTYNNPIISLFHYWIMYMTAVTVTGQLRPYPDMEAMDYKDYNTRIYRITLDAQGERVTGIYATGAATPSSNSVSQNADYNRQAPIMETNKDFTISFECDGMIVLDPILYYTFNSVVEAFCPGMRPEYRENFMVKIDKFERNFFRGLGYPRIDPQTNMFEIYVPSDLYNMRMRAIGDLVESSRTSGLDYSNSSQPTTQNSDVIWA